MATKKTTKESNKKQKDYFELPRAIGHCADYGMSPRDYPEKHHISSTPYKLRAMKKKMLDNNNPPE